MKEIFLIRHGATSFNEEGKYLGITDIPLSPAGIAQSHLLGQRLKGEELDVIYTSPMLRARQTAEIIASYTKTPVKELPELKEIDFGLFEGKTYDEIKKEFGNFIDLWLENPYEVQLPKGEHPGDIKKRILKLKDTLLRGTDKIAAVSHGGIIKFLIFEILGLAPHFWKISISNGSLTHLAFLSSVPSIIVMNDTSHLKQ